MRSNEFEMGREAYSDYKELEDNPFEKGSDESGRWDAGFRYAARNDPFSPENM